MKKLLLLLLAACGSSQKPVAPPPAAEAPLATRGPDKTEPPADAADRKHAFAILPTEQKWSGSAASVGPDQSLIRVAAGTPFDVTGGAAVVVAGAVKNERGEQLYAWANKAHKLECVKGADCLVFLDKSTHVDGLEVTKLEWAKLDPAREDPLVAPLWGDGKTGPNGFLMKMKPGGGPFWHIHRRDYHGVVLQGTVVSYESGSQPKEMAPGSYWWQPNGNKHTTDCKGTTECIVYLDFTGPFDVKAVP